MILIYNDEGVSQNCLQAIVDFFCINFSHYSLKIVSSDQLLMYLDTASIFVMPGGYDTPYSEKLKGIPNLAIQKFIKSGGAYLGICAGAYYACSSIKFTGEGYSIFQERELSLFEGVGIGSIPEFTNGVFFDDSSNTKSVISLDTIKNVYYHGGCWFDNIKNSQILSYYPIINKPAIIRGQYGTGKFLLSGVHFEVIKSRYQKFQIPEKLLNSKKEKEIYSLLPNQDHYSMIQWITELFNTN